MASRRLIKGIRSLAPKAFKTTKLSPVILPRGSYYGGDGLYCRGGHKMPHGKEKPCKGGDFF